jgi:hypothetical protein
MRGKTHSVCLTPHEVSRVQIWGAYKWALLQLLKKTKTEFQLFFFITLGKEERSSFKGDKRREEEG